MNTKRKFAYIALVIFAIAIIFLYVMHDSTKASRFASVGSLAPNYDLGYSGAPINTFVDSYAPNATKYSDFHDAFSSYNLSVAYDPDGYLDIYYLIGPNGKILYENYGLSATLPQLKQEIDSV